MKTNEIPQASKFSSVEDYLSALSKCNKSNPQPELDADEEMDQAIADCE